MVYQFSEHNVAPWVSVSGDREKPWEQYIQYNAMHCSAVAVQFSAVKAQHNAAQHNTIQYSKPVQYNTVQYNIKQYSTV